MEDKCKTGRVTIPTDLDVVPETLEILKKWGADAIRDCDGTDFPQELKNADAKIYSTYYTTRKDNAWAKANPDEVQQCYIMTGFYTAPGETVTIPLMKGISPELMKVNDHDDITRWWEVMDRSTGQPVPPEQWSYADGSVTVQAVPFHEYTVSFLAYLIWDPVHMYNATTNGWTNFEHQITFDVRQPKTHKYSMERLRKFIAEHPYVNVIRYTTFFHQFTLIFDELKREKFVDWYGYSASVSPYILNQFEQEVGYKFRPEYIIDQGYYNNQYRVPKAGQRNGGHHARVRLRGDDVPGRSLDRHRAFYAGVQDHRAGCRGGQRGQWLHAAPDLRHRGREVHGRTLSALLLPGHVP